MKEGLKERIMGCIERVRKLGVQVVNGNWYYRDWSHGGPLKEAPAKKCCALSACFIDDNRKVDLRLQEAESKIHFIAKELDLEPNEVSNFVSGFDDDRERAGELLRANEYYQLGQQIRKEVLK